MLSFFSANSLSKLKAFSILSLYVIILMILINVDVVNNDNTNLAKDSDLNNRCFDNSNDGISVSTAL